MKFGFDFSEEKDLILIETRKVSFKDIIQAYKKGKKLDDFRHSNPKIYPNQRMLVVEIGGYAYAVPYVVDKQRRKLFLKTLYPSKKFTNKYLKKYENTKKI